jgi:7-cyano-7-deazaguanine synthase
MTLKLDAALVVLSGGQDSTTCLFMAKKMFREVHAVTFDYNQRHAREIQAAKDVANLAGVDSHQVISIGPILHGRSPLTNPSESLELYQDYDQMDKTIGDRVELTFVPMRNALFLTLAANYAICKDVTTIITGVCEQDNANYPDCRQEFIWQQENTINLALGLPAGTISIGTPLIDLSKAEAIRKCVYSFGGPSGTIGDAYVALAFSHTAYDGNYPPVGKDHASVLRAQGFLESGYPDPLVIRAVSEELMELPVTSNYQDMDFNFRVLELINHFKIRLGYAPVTL